MTIQPGALLYTQGFGSRPEGVEVPHIENRAPTASDNTYDIGKMWVDSAGGIGYLLTSYSMFNGIKSANWAFLGAAAGDLNTLTTADAVVVTPVAGNIDVVGSGSTTTTGAGDTVTVTLTGLTNHNVLVGAGTSTITKVAPSATAGVALVSAGAAADPEFGTVVVAGGGTGLTTLTAHQLYVGNGTSAPNTVVNGTTGQVLTAVTGADPTFQAPAASSISITGDSGGALVGDAFTFTGGTTGLTFSGGGSTETLTGTLAVANGGTSLATLTAHALYVGNGTSAPTALAVGTTGQALVAATGADPAFGTLPVAGGGTGLTTLTAHALYVGNGTSAPTALSVGATGTLLAGSTGADPVFTGSPSVSGSLTAATTITATLGAITATNGNFVGSTAGTGLLFNANAASGAAPGPIVLNSRAGQVTFTGVSIAAAADLTLTITNSEITGAGTQVIYSMSGSTTGSAPSIKSVTNSAGSSAIVVTNGTGATTTTADITFNFIVVN